MFDLTPHYEQPQKISLLVEVVMDDGTNLKGEIEVPEEGGLPIILNGLNQFIEVRSYDGEMHYISKESMRTVRPMQLPEKPGFTDKLKNFLRSDPYQVLGISKESDSKTINDAYQRQLKNFHEILDHLDASYKGLNDAYHNLAGKTQKLESQIVEPQLHEQPHH